MQNLRENLALAYAERQKAVREAVTPGHEAYVTFVSEPDMAASLEACVLLGVLVSWLRPARILDLGSGVSSYVLRAVAESAQLGAEVVSVDTDRHWLEKTREFCAKRQLDTGAFLAWEELRQRETQPCDLVFFDLDHPPARQGFLPEVVSRFLAPEGVLLVDDMHFPRYRQAVLSLLAERGACLVNVAPQTLDSWGRYCLLAVNVG